MPTAAQYWQKDVDNSSYKDLAWNFPEQKQGIIKIIGGNSSSFAAEVKTAEYINRTFPFVKSVENVFPDALKAKFPPMDNLKFYESTDSGSFSNTPEFRRALDNVDAGIILGDLSKNSITAIAISDLIRVSDDIPLVLTRDTVDLVASTANDFINRGKITFVASMASLQKLLRSLYYPRPIMLSQPIFPVVETLHKFTISYPVSIMTFHEGKIICAYNGKVSTIDIDKTRYTPLSLWSGEVAARLAVFAMFNTNRLLESMLAAITYK
ncbi:hypothetical protein IKG06_01005 [Candidatus Saccharibacteria bacterium]|nr:hypothetical protein [Candidatus Saccharibacteria bacterium]